MLPSQPPPGGVAAPHARSSSASALDPSAGPTQRLGNYHIGQEIGRGSFATVHRAYRTKTHQLVAIKAVSRQKLTAKLLENLESEINILKAINHRNIVGLEDCFKSDSHIYLVMEYCTGSDLSFYIKQRGKLDTLDFVPRPGMFPGKGPLSLDQNGKMFWPHPAAGGIEERVTRCFLGQLAGALRFLRRQNLIHRDIKPQNLLMQPPTPAEILDGHPLGVPVLKVADFGFARILPAAAMAETLCGSPLYMAPEILRYERYDAKADLWSVGAVLYEMAVGKPPFRANNHVELLRRIEKGEDRIKFPDESTRPGEEPKEPVGVPPCEDIKELIRKLLKRKPAERMDFPAFFESGVWDGFMSESMSSEGESSMSPDLLSVEGSSEVSVSVGDRMRRSRDMRRSREVEAEQRLKEAVDRERARFNAAVGRKEKEKEMPTEEWTGHHVKQPTTADPALNPAPAPAPSPALTPTRPAPPAPSSTPYTRPLPASPPIIQHTSPTPRARPSPPPTPIITSPTPAPRQAAQAPRQTPVRRSEPKYYVSDDPPPPSRSPTAPPRPNPPPRQPTVSSSTATTPKAPAAELTNYRQPTSNRRISNAGVSPDEPTPVTPPTNQPPSFGRTRVSEGSPLASTPPITRGVEDESMDSSEVVGREYVMVEKQTVEVNALADEFDQASRVNQALVRRPSSRISVVTRPVSALKPSAAPSSQSSDRAPPIPNSYSPPAGLSSTPPFAVQPSTLRRPSSSALTRPSSIPHAHPPQPSLTVFPPGFSPENLVSRLSASPSSLQTGALARALTNTAIRMIGHGANTAAIALARATNRPHFRPRTSSGRRMSGTAEVDPAEEELLKAVEDLARKAFALFELGDVRLGNWNTLAQGRRDVTGLSRDPAQAQAQAQAQVQGSSSPFADNPIRRKSSSSSTNSEVLRLREQELAAGEACVLYCKALGFIVKGTNMIQRYWEERAGVVGEAGVELNEMVQWLRARFNECYEKAEWAKLRCAEELPFVERLLHDKARDMSRQGAIAELQGDLPVAEAGYENALWLLMALLDEAMYDGGGIKEEDRISVEKVINPIRTRLNTLRQKMVADTKPT